MDQEAKIDHNSDVVVRCGYCGALWCFYPYRVMNLLECRCGSDNYGNPSKGWPESKFGDFDLIFANTLPLDRLHNLLGVPYLSIFNRIFAPRKFSQ